MLRTTILLLPCFDWVFCHLVQLLSFHAYNMTFQYLSTLVNSKLVWLGSLMITCQTCNPEVRLRTGTLPGNDLRQVVHTHVLLSSSSIIWYQLHRWDVNRHTARYTGPVSVVSQCKNWRLAESLRKRRSAPPYGPNSNTQYANWDAKNSLRVCTHARGLTMLD